MNYMILFKSLRKILLLFLVYILIFESIFQILFFFDFKLIKRPILYYNGYCDQKYWNLYDEKMEFSENVTEHPILSYKKNSVFIPNEFQVKKIIKENFVKDNIALYGSSYINHKILRSLLSKYENIKFENYALESYGLDQIYLSYMLTSHLNQNRFIIIGFLLEDLDRSIFYKREYQKALFYINENTLNLKNIPIDHNRKLKNNKDFYLFRFTNNFYNLIKNKFDPRMDKCLIKEKKKIFSYFFENIKKESKKFNQKLIVITFNLQEDITKKTSWRHEFVKNYFKESNIKHIDSLEVMNKKIKENSENVELYFGRDRHNNKRSYEYILNEFYKIYKAM